MVLAPGAVAISPLNPGGEASGSKSQRLPEPILKETQRRESRLLKLMLVSAEKNVSCLSTFGNIR